MTMRTLIPLALFAALLLTGCGGDALRGGVLEPPREAPPIELTDHQGRPFSLEAQRGKVVLLFFGYTSCPDVCPTTLADMLQAKRALGQAFDDVRVAFITVDPTRDTQDQLSRYMPLFDRDFLGLTGSPIELRRVMNAYQVKAVRRDSTESDAYSIDHSAFTYVIDKQGHLRELLTYGAPVEDVVHDLNKLLAE